MFIAPTIPFQKKTTDDTRSNSRLLLLLRCALTPRRTLYTFCIFCISVVEDT